MKLPSDSESFKVNKEAMMIKCTFNQLRKSQHARLLGQRLGNGLLCYINQLARNHKLAEQDYHCKLDTALIYGDFSIIYIREPVESGCSSLLSIRARAVKGLLIQPITNHVSFSHHLVTIYLRCLNTRHDKTNAFRVRQ